MLKFNFLSMPIIFSMYKTGILYAGLNNKLTSRIQVKDLSHSQIYLYFHHSNRVLPKLP